MGMITMWILIGFFLLGLTMLVYMLKEAFSNRVIKHEIQLNNFPESLGKVAIFFITDIHKRTIADSIIQQVKGKTDIVIIGGDLVEKKVPFSRVVENIKKLKEVGPVYFVWGNNDYEVDYHELDATLLDNGIKILDNTAVTFESEKGEKLILLGIDDMNVGRDRLDLALLDAGNEGCKILVSHNPKVMDLIKPEHDISLVLSGHTHGGQIHIFGYSPYEVGGISTKNDTTFLISNGYGTTALPLRLGAPAETHLIIIESGQR